MYETFEAAFAAGAGSIEGGRVLEPVGVCAAVNPAVPERSVFNSVLYESHEALAAALDELARRLRRGRRRARGRSGCRSPTATRRGMLEDAGHRHDATRSRWCSTSTTSPDPDAGDLDWDAEATLEEVCSVNDRAYGYPDGTFARGMGRPPEGVRASTAPASTVSRRACRRHRPRRRLRRLVGRDAAGGARPRADRPADARRARARAASAAATSRPSRRRSSGRPSTRRSATATSARSRCGSAGARAS